MIAALYVEKGGAYYGIPDVDPWDEERDARLYAGPWPVVAHPPCQRWSTLAAIVEAVHGYKRGEDGGCFEAALKAVRTWGGVIEHPALSAAWNHFNLPIPKSAVGWTQDFFDEGASCYVEQRAYGHQLRKPTWLYAYGVELPALRWTDGWTQIKPEDQRWGLSWRKGQKRTPGLVLESGGQIAIGSPPAFRDLLLEIARSAL